MRISFRLGRQLCRGHTHRVIRATRPRLPGSGGVCQGLRCGTRQAMATMTRVLDPEPVRSLEAYRSAGGGLGLEAARKLGPAGTIAEIEASGLRGRGGAGFPTATKWAAVADKLAPGLRPSVVVNASEGEPGSFKDRMLIRRNPYRIIEGAVIAAETLDAERIVFAVKA